jgi:predicted  nucleic acid-binding Zn-ribbon protein
MIDWSNKNVKEKQSLLKQIEKLDIEINKLARERRTIDKKIDTKKNKQNSLWKEFYKEEALQEVQV